MPDAVTFRPASAADVQAFLGGPPPARLRGYVAILDGEVVGLGGVYYHAGTPVAFSDIKPPLRKHRKALAKGCRILMDFIREMNVPVYALANQEEPTASYLLCKLGFKPTGQVTPLGEYLVKEPD